MTAQTETLNSLVKLPGYAARFRELLRERSDQFVSSLLQVGSTMPDVEPRSIIAAAMTAAALDLPINKNLGFAWIVPYNDTKRGRKLAQFQMGWKGFVQLAQRSGQYQALAPARSVNKEAFAGYDSIGLPKIDWALLDETLPAIGYSFAWRLVNGGESIFFWTEAKIKAHAQRYSQAFRKGSDTPWKTHFPEMAKKTVVKNSLSQFGILSIQMQTALSADQSVSTDPDAEPEYLEGAEDLDAGDTVPSREPVAVDKTLSAHGESTQISPASSQAKEDPEAGHNLTPTKPISAAPIPAPAVPEAPTGAKVAAETTTAGDVSRPSAAKIERNIATSPADAPAAPAPKRRKQQLNPQAEMPIAETPQPAQFNAACDILAKGATEHGVSFERFRKWVMRQGYPIRDVDSMASWDQLPEKWCVLWLKSGELLWREVCK